MFFFSALCGYALTGGACQYKPLFKYEKPVPLSAEKKECIGGDGGGDFSVHYNGSWIEELYAWSDDDDDDHVKGHTKIRALEIHTFADALDNRRSKVIGEKPAHKADAYIKFSPGELITGDITLGDNGYGTRMGYISFKTSKNQTFSVGSLHTPSIFDADGTMLSGFFGRSGADIDALGLYLVKPIAKVSIEKVTYHDLASLINKTPKIVKFDACNDGDEGALAFTLKYSVTKGSTSKWGVSATMGLDLTESVTVEAGIPTLLDVSATASAKESFFTTGSHELSENHVETKDITVDWTVGARRKAVYTSQWLDSKVVDLPYSGELVLTFKDGTSWKKNFSSTYDGTTRYEQHKITKHQTALKEGEQCSQDGGDTCKCIYENDCSCREKMTPRVAAPQTRSAAQTAKDL